jgi:anthranilate/para-aminobenzoate synthase component I
LLRQSHSVGSGITAGSVPAREYEETLHKASGMRMALDAYSQLQKTANLG